MLKRILDWLLDHPFAMVVGVVVAIHLLVATLAYIIESRCEGRGGQIVLDHSLRFSTPVCVDKSSR